MAEVRNGCGGHPCKHCYLSIQYAAAVKGSNIAEEAPNSWPREHSYSSWGTGIADDHAHGNAMYRRTRVNAVTVMLTNVALVPPPCAC